MSVRQWYRITNKAETPTVARIDVYDEIGKSFFNDNAVTAKQFVEDLAALPAAVERVVVHVNSPGGSAFEAITIANALRAQSKEQKRVIEMVIDGLAASAATIITSAGDVIRMADNAVFMIHDPATVVFGNAKDMRETADTLDKVRDAIVRTYQWVTNLAAEEIQNLMAATTYMDAEEAKAKGFITDIISGGEPVTAAFRPEALGEVPERFRARVDALLKKDAPAPEPKPTAMAPASVLAACSAAGLDVAFAQTLLTSPLTDAEVSARIATESDIRAKAEQRRTEIVAVCKTSKLETLADGYIASGMPLDAVKAHLLTVTAVIDQKTAIDNTLGPDGPVVAKKTNPLNPTDLYNARRAATTNHKERA